MYFIISGDCVVSYLDANQREVLSNFLLSEGNHFGEISALFNCPRTSTVIGRNYNIMSNISQQYLKYIISQHPEFHQSLLKCIYSQRDEKKKFIYRAVKSIDFFKNISVDDFHKLMFKMETRIITEKEYILRQGNKIKSIVIVQHGQLEVIKNM